MWKRVIAPTALISVLWIAVSIATTVYITWLSDSYSRALSENMSTIRAAGAMQDALWKLHAAAFEPPDRQDGENRQAVAEYEAAFCQSLEEARLSAFTTEEKLLIERIEDSFDTYRRHVQRRLDALAKPGDPAPPAPERTVRLALAVEEPCRQLIELNERLMAESAERRARYGSLVTVVRLSFLAVGPVLGLLLGLWVARWLHRTISQISITLGGAAGELEREVGRVTIHPRSDLPQLQEQVQAVSARIRQVAEELQQARREAMRAERLAAVGQLAAGVAHELRNPLTSIKLLVQAAAKRRPSRPLDDRQLNVLQQEIARMENIIQGLLDYARPARLHRVRHDLRDTTRRALNLVEGRAKQQRVAIVRDLGDRPAMVDGDPEQLHQVFVNLALNGIESMEEGGTLRIQVATDLATARCRVVFSDSGVGIPQAVLEHIFEPFVTSKERGTGLGLAISRRIVQEHGGALSATNRPGGGAEFTVELPTCAATATAGEVPDRPIRSRTTP
ncbi:MAG: ATP-binding protein [Thermoguttaceae bacterium]|jgi:signal transduction histidine kinase|nr:ATP-binding protein [Thermoguttaceae bacterium]